MVKNKLIEVLESIGYPVYLQGSFTEEQEYPDTFFTYWRFDAPEPSHYNNQAFSCNWGFWIYVYSDNPRTLEKETKRKWIYASGKLGRFKVGRADAYRKYAYSSLFRNI